MSESTRVGIRPAPLKVRRDAEIYSTDGGWFKGRWHFSFDQYYDPENMGIGTLRVFNHDTLVPGATWPMHPHRDVEGITYVPAGQFEHRDSLGNDGVLEAGGVQRMTLGSGALHSESNHSQTEPVEFIQMWIMPADRGLPPSVEQKQYGQADRHNRLLQILRPAGTEGEGVTVHQQVWMYVARLDPGAEAGHVFREGRGGYFYLIDGALELNGEQLSKGDAAKVLGDGLLHIRATGTSELLIVDTPL
jgi:redox-sensitive bicupin YhaK (pirin superfamily)